jgi:hypothetical protein
MQQERSICSDPAFLAILPDRDQLTKQRFVGQILLAALVARFDDGGLADAVLELEPQHAPPHRCSSPDALRSSFGARFLWRAR